MIGSAKLHSTAAQLAAVIALAMSIILIVHVAFFY